MLARRSSSRPRSDPQVVTSMGNFTGSIGHTSHTHLLICFGEIRVPSDPINSSHFLIFLPSLSKNNPDIRNRHVMSAMLVVRTNPSVMVASSSMSRNMISLRVSPGSLVTSTRSTPVSSKKSDNHDYDKKTFPSSHPVTSSPFPFCGRRRWIYHIPPSTGSRSFSRTER